MKVKIKLAVVNDEALVLEGLCFILNRENHISVVMSAVGGEEFLSKLKDQSQKWILIGPSGADKSTFLKSLQLGEAKQIISRRNAKFIVQVD